MLTRLARVLGSWLGNPQRHKASRQKKHLMKQKHRDFVMSLFGVRRYYLSLIFGQWVLYI